MLRARLVPLFVLFGVGCTQKPNPNVSSNTVVQKYPFTVSAFEKMESDKKFIINGLYRDYTSSYPGAISKDVACPEEFRPTAFQFSNATMKISGFIMFANQRRAYGSCSKEKSAYRVFDGVIHCSANNLAIDFKYFVEPSTTAESLKTQLQQLDCSSL